MRTKKTKVDKLIILKSKKYQVNVLREPVVNLKNKKV